MNVATQRNDRERIAAMMRRDLLLPGAVAREVGVSVEALLEWLDGAKKSAPFVESIRQFETDRTEIWKALESAGNELREQFALRMISGVGSLVYEMERTQDGRRADVRDQILMYLKDIRGVLELMVGDAAQTPERLAETIGSALGPGDKMLIARAGNKARAREVGTK
jgi:hypothetical protein